MSIASKKSLTLAGARDVVAAAVNQAKKNDITGVVIVVDNGGKLMALERVDGAFAAGANISIDKARTAVLFKKPTNVQLGKVRCAASIRPRHYNLIDS
jgi:glc operon protein GlcG